MWKSSQAPGPSTGTLVLAFYLVVWVWPLLKLILLQIHSITHWASSSSVEWNIYWNILWCSSRKLFRIISIREREKNNLHNLCPHLSQVEVWLLDFLKCKMISKSAINWMIKNQFLRQIGNVCIKHKKNSFRYSTTLVKYYYIKLSHVANLMMITSLGGKISL